MTPVIKPSAVRQFCNGCVLIHTFGTYPHRSKRVARRGAGDGLDLPV